MTANKNTPRGRLIFATPLWVSEICVSADGDNAHAVIEWITRAGRRHRRDAMPLHNLVDARSTSKWLVGRGVVGFDTTRDDVWTYLRVFVQFRSEKHDPRIVDNMKAYIETLRK